jgi:hypothetical protein
VKKVAIVQSNYIPWKGYFHMIHDVDEFILFDDMQYTRRDWRNRNDIKTPNGLLRLSVPVKTKGKYFQKIQDTQIDGNGWAKEHWTSITLNYKKAPYFKEISELLEPLYLNTKYNNISELNQTFLKAVCRYMNINTIISKSSDYQIIEGKTERLANICLQANADEYISGKAAQIYMEPKVFSDLEIKLTWFEYPNYREYSQLWGEYIHNVSVIDLLFNCGSESLKYIIKGHL